jgi:CrcB protein
MALNLRVERGKTNKYKDMLKSMFIAGLGGFIGTCLRYLTGKMCHALVVAAFPWGTFVVNIVGSFLIGIFFALAEKGGVISPAMNVFLITGFCGGLTTFSSFADDMYLLLQQRHWIVFLLYATLTFALGLLMVLLGRWAVKG